MAFNVPATPQRPLPGAFFQTPAPGRFGQQPNLHPPVWHQPQAQTQQQAPQNANPPTNPQNLALNPNPQSQLLPPIKRAAQTINDALQREALYPDLDSYVKQGISSNYELPEPMSEPAWLPFQKTRTYDIPDSVFDQFNRASLQTLMGLFAELGRAWVAIDNCLYLWDFTDPEPQLEGYEELTNNITAVKLIVPRRGVFAKGISHVIVIATVAELVMVPLEESFDEHGIRHLQLFRSTMSLPLKGIDVSVIEGSAASGRVFFAGAENYVYELMYQNEDKWFSSKCGKVNHSNPSYSALVPTLWAHKSLEFVVNMVVDDSRGLLYTLTNLSTIRTFHMDSPTTLTLVIQKTRGECLRDISHMIQQSSILDSTMRIASISPISAYEGTKLHLMATTTTGCRLFLSATRGYGYGFGSQPAGDPPKSMQVQHIRFPPAVLPASPRPKSAAQYQVALQDSVDTSSKALCFTNRGDRLPPGFFFCFVQKEGMRDQDALFLSAPDTARIAFEGRGITGSKYYESAFWLALGGRACAVGLLTSPNSAAKTPQGFGNELAVQYDQASPEIAILTDTGIHIIRRRRAVDMFAAAIRSGGDDGLEGEIKKFVRQYGRTEATATALAVACGQGSDATNTGETRVTRITDPDTIEAARSAFIEHGGRPSIDQNLVVESPAQAVENVHPSARHDGLALYVSRLVRGLWKFPVMTERLDPVGEANAQILITSTVSVAKLAEVQDELRRLATFLNANRAFIEGLAGPDAISSRVTSQQEEILLQGEHQALHSLQLLNTSIVEGIAFVQMFFEERVNDIWISLDDTIKQQLRELTFEALFTTDAGRDLAKLMVKEIVNRNISQGANVDTVADALRRRCGSFCSPDDVVVFKAQEQLARAKTVGAASEHGNTLLNESLRLFSRVAGTLSFQNVELACNQMTELQFFAGAIQLALVVAKEYDRGNRAVSWVSDGKPDNDPRQAAYAFRKQCYDLVHFILNTADTVTSAEPDTIDGRRTSAATKRIEAHRVVDEAEDEVFQFDLYDWYLANGWHDRLLDTESRFVVVYLQRGAINDVDTSDLLWRYHVHREDFHAAAAVQLSLAKSDMPIGIKKRIEYLSRAKANASTQGGRISRQARQILLHEINELLEVANVQDEVLSRLMADERLTDPNDRQAFLDNLDGPVQDMSWLFNTYADSAEYFDICLEIYNIADHRGINDIASTWVNLINQVHTKCLQDQGQAPFEGVISRIREMAQRLAGSDLVFNAQCLVPVLEDYAFTNQQGTRHWVMELCISVHFQYEAIYTALEEGYRAGRAPFIGRDRAWLAGDMLYIAEEWYQDCARNNERMFGGANQARAITASLREVRATLDPHQQRSCDELCQRITSVLR